MTRVLARARHRVIVPALIVAVAACGGSGSSDAESTETDGAPSTPVTETTVEDDPSSSTSPPTTVPQTTASVSTTMATSTTVAPPPPTPAPTTVAAPAPAPPTTVQLSAADLDELPTIPAQVEGYTPYDGVRTDTFRVFEGGGSSTPLSFRGQMNNCGTAFWVARWRTVNPDVGVQGGRGPYDADVVDYEVEPYLMPPAQPFGYISGFICERPIFLWGYGSSDGSNLTDVVIEWQYYDVSVGSGGLPAPTPSTCSSYELAFELPVQLCDEGIAVGWLQGALQQRGYALDSDGLFGPGTAEAVRQFQSDNGLEADGVVGPATWRALGGGAGLPGYDLDGDGMITPEEIAYD